MSTREMITRRRPAGPAAPLAVLLLLPAGLVLACLGAGAAPPQPAAPPEQAEPRHEAPGGAVAPAAAQQEEDPERRDPDPEVDDPEWGGEDPEAPPEARPDEGPAGEDEVERPGEGYLWGGRPSGGPDPTLTPEGTLTLFMRARNYRTIRILKSLMTPSLQASFDRDSARFNGKQNVALSAFHFQTEGFKAVHYAESGAGKEADIYDATVRSLWTDQGELADRRREVVRLVREASGVWRVGRLDIAESDRSRYQELIPSVTSLRKVLRAWHYRQAAPAEPLLTDAFVKTRGTGEDGVAGLFEGDDAERHAAFEIRQIDWREKATRATAHVDLYVTARNRFGSLEPRRSIIGLIQVGPGWYVDSWETGEATDRAGL
jgi:hypothetical protein